MMVGQGIEDGGGDSAGRRYASARTRRQGVSAVSAGRAAAGGARPAAAAPATDIVFKSRGTKAALQGKTVGSGVALGSRRGLDLLGTAVDPTAGQAMAGSHRHGIYQRVYDE